VFLNLILTMSYKCYTLGSWQNVVIVLYFQQSAITEWLTYEFVKCQQH
jgi:hypothetical protein